MKPELQVASCPGFAKGCAEASRLQVPQANVSARFSSTFNLQPLGAAKPCGDGSTFNLRHAFTLVEMLAVIAILGVLAALLVPSLKNIGHADAMTAATRQMLDDVGRARQLAISQHTTVYMVFVPEIFWNGLNTAQRAMPATTNLCDKQLTGYTFVSLRSVGDQPGQGKPHYIAPWQNLPDGTFIAEGKFNASYTISNSISGKTFPISQFNYTNNIPFPTEDSLSNTNWLPYIAFNYLGQLTFDGQNPANRDEYIPLARGSVAPAITPTTKAYQLGSPIITETPDGNSTNAYNIIDIEPLTGRATLQQPKVQ